MNFTISKFEEGTFVHPRYLDNWFFAWAIGRNYSFVEDFGSEFACLNIEEPKEEASAFYKMVLGTADEEFEILFALKTFKKLSAIVKSIDVSTQPRVGVNEFQLVMIPCADYTFVCCEEMLKGIVGTLNDYENRLKNGVIQHNVDDIISLLGNKKQE